MKISVISVISMIGSAIAQTDSPPLGINCRGSSNCAGNIGNMGDIYNALQNLNPSNYYSTGQHITCARNICAFYQNQPGGTAGDAVGYVKALIDHGCQKCGSDPTQPGNNVNDGELTVNWVLNP